MDYNNSEKKRSLFKRGYLKTKEFIESLFGPLIILLAKILGKKTGYKKGEKLILMVAQGDIPAKARIEFVKLSDAGNPFSGTPLIAAKYKDRTIVVPEHFTKERSYLKRALTAYEFNVKMIKSNRKLGKSHPFIIPRLAYKLYYLPSELWVKLKEKFSE